MTTDNPTTEAPSAAAGGETIEVTYSYDEVMRKINAAWDTAEAASRELDMDSVVAPRIEWGRNAFNFLMTNIEAHVNKQQATITSLEADLKAAETRERGLPNRELSQYAQVSYVDNLPEITDDEVEWRHGYFTRLIEKSQERIDDAKIILVHIENERNRRQAARATAEEQS